MIIDACVTANQISKYLLSTYCVQHTTNRHCKEYKSTRSPSL